MGNRSISPRVRSAAHRSISSWVGMSPVPATAGSPARHCLIRVVSRAGRTHTPAPAATSGWGPASNRAANAAAGTGSVPSTPASSPRACSSPATGAHSATTIHAPSGDTT